MTWASPWMTSVKAEPPYTDVDKLGQTTLLLHLHSTTATHWEIQQGCSQCEGEIIGKETHVK